MPELLNISDFRKSKFDTLAALSDVSRHPIHSSSPLIAYACGLTKRLEPYVRMLAEFDVLVVCQLSEYTEEQFFGRFRFEESPKKLFLEKIKQAGGTFAPS